MSDVVVVGAVHGLAAGGGGGGRLYADLLQALVLHGAQTHK